MEFFNQAKSVRLKSHLGKYLVADDDEQTVRQSTNGSSRKARWLVEPAGKNPHAVRLRGCHGLHLTASDEAFLLGMTGKKVRQTNRVDGSIDWEPIKEGGFWVRLRTQGGKFLRANGATPPWRNSVTHDLPHRTATQDWVLWEVEAVEIGGGEDLQSNVSSFNSVQLGEGEGEGEDYESASSCPNSPYAVPVKSERRATSFASELLRRSMGSDKRRPSIKSDRISSLGNGLQNGMEFFNKAKAVRLQSHLGKYLIADEDESTVRQSRNGASRRARWTVEFVAGKRNSIRLKSCHGLYLTASDEAFLLGMTGKKVILQTAATSADDVSTEWEPVKEGPNSVKLMSNSNGKFLRANGGGPPWRNSVTHDVPHRTTTQSWVLWGVEVVEISEDTGFDLDDEDSSNCSSPASPFSSFADDNYMGTPDTGSPVVGYRTSPRDTLINQVSGMDFFLRAKTVRLKSHHDKYLTAESDEETVVQDRAGSSPSARWTVEFIPDADTVIRLKSRYGKYLRASDSEFLLGVTGRKVHQSLPRKLDSSVEWEPVRDGMQVKLKTRYGNFLRANGGLPPWRNSITHDIPHRHRDWVLWEVDVMELRPQSPPRAPPRAVEEEEEEEEDVGSTSFHFRTPVMTTRTSFEDSSKKSEGRLIYYCVADDEDEVDDAIERSFQFKGHGLEELSQRLEEETGIEDIIVCSRNIVTQKLYPLRLALPPNNVTMHVVVVPPTSKAANEFLPPAPAST